MSKELEALRVLKANAILFDDGTDFGASMLEAISELDKYLLTPPTADEVCEALSEYLGKEVTYIDDVKKFAFNGFHGWEELCYFGKVVKNNDVVRLNYVFPPQLIILIGRFYEGEIK